MHEVSAIEWEEVQSKLNGHFLQSDAWAQFQRSLGRGRMLRRATGQWSVQAFAFREKGWQYAYAAMGPTLEAEGGGILQKSNWLGAGVDFVRAEPQGQVSAQQLRQLGWVPSIELNPARTAVVDLTLSEDELRRNLTSGHRSAINGAGRRGLSFREGKSEEIEVLISLIKQTGRRRGFHPHPDGYYRKMAEVLMPLGAAKLCLAEAEGKPVAASVVFDYRGERIYAHAAADPASRKLQAAVPLVWHMIMEAKAAGMKSFDLWGVAPDGAGPEHPWAGFSQFKRAFGGREVERVGTWDLPLKPVKYRAYLAARAFNRWARL